ncbi:PREDICTED: Fc receptor-like protein 4 [Condylura cristata]|uniref:Fc receptor-like protein 4 n=1 Tax=Condylura cristata TaxID=143302 RepID=UPI000642E2A5|nr:PREDICTED: Fc receptor-like protein 4 [Condylura cristata]
MLKSSPNPEFLSMEGEEKAAHKSVISLYPPWTTFFRGESVSLTCSGFHVNATETMRGYVWYKTKGLLREATRNTLVVAESGDYWCQAPGSLPSNPVHLLFSSGLLILQAPHSVFEGDTLILRCHKKDFKVIAVKYTLNGKVIFTSNKSWELLIPQASLHNSGSYQCLGFLERNYIIKSNVKFIQIQELFSTPTLEATTSQPTEGHSINLSCETQLSPERQDTLLHFSFFRDSGVTLSRWSSSPKLQITAIWSEDSGAYRCGVKTPTSNVPRCSRPLQVHVQRVPVSGVLLETQPPRGQLVEGQKLVLICSVAEGTGNTTFSWYRKHTNESLGKKSQRARRAELETAAIRDSHAGEYYCTADNGYGLIHSGALNITLEGTPWYRCGMIAVGAIGGILSVFLATVLLFYCWSHRKSGDGFLEDTARTPPTPGAEDLPYPKCPAPMEMRLLDVHSQQEEITYSEIQIIKLGKEEEAAEPSLPSQLPSRPPSPLLSPPGFYVLVVLVGVQRVEELQASQKHQPSSLLSLPPGLYVLVVWNASVIYAELKTEFSDVSGEKVNSKDEDSMGDRKAWVADFFLKQLQVLYRLGIVCTNWLNGERLCGYLTGNAEHLLPTYPGHAVRTQLQTKEWAARSGLQRKEFKIG